MRGRYGQPLSIRILRALHLAGRPLTRSELTAWFICDRAGRSKIQAELDRMVTAGELVDAGMRPPSPRDRMPGSRPQRLYGPAETPLRIPR